MSFSDATPIENLAPSKPANGLFVMPERIDKNGVGYYGEEASAVYKELLALGADAKYYTTEQSGIHRFGAKEEIITFIIGFFIEDIPKAIAYDLLKSFVFSVIKRRPKSTFEGRVLIGSETNKLSTWQEYKVTGTVNDAIRMIDKIQELHSNESRTGTEKTK